MNDLAKPNFPAMRPRDVALRARELKKKYGLSSAELGDRLDVSSSAIHKAVNWNDNPNMHGLRVKIIEALTDSTIEGPIYLESRGDPD